MKTFVVIGLGRFGTALATELCALGNDVLAIDNREDLVQSVADRVTHAAAGDARDPAVLQALGVRNCDCAIVAVGDDIGNSALIALGLKELGVPEVVCKAQSDVHKRVLEKIGADRVVIPEYEMGVKLAQNLSRSSVINFIELSKEYGIVEIVPPQQWVGRTLRELDIRGKHHVTIIGARKAALEQMEIAPHADYVIEKGDRLVVLGRYVDTNRLGAV